MSFFRAWLSIPSLWASLSSLFRIEGEKKERKRMCKGGMCKKQGRKDRKTIKWRKREKGERGAVRVWTVTKGCVVFYVYLCEKIKLSFIASVKPEQARDRFSEGRGSLRKFWKSKSFCVSPVDKNSDGNDDDKDEADHYGNHLMHCNCTCEGKKTEQSQ